MYLVTGWQRFTLYAGMPFPNGEPNPPHISPLDLTSGSLKTRVHKVTLEAGDCVFVPSYWWYQVAVPKEPQELALLATYQYDVASAWVDLVMYGVQNQLL